jgi:hypothetical protein
LFGEQKIILFSYHKISTTNDAFLPIKSINRIKMDGRPSSSNNIYMIVPLKKELMREMILFLKSGLDSGFFAFCKIILTKNPLLSRPQFTFKDSTTNIKRPSSILHESTIIFA